MTENPPRLQVRRPPAPPEGSTRVIRLAPPPSADEVPVDPVQGTLALDLGGRSAPPEPELRLVEEGAPAPRPDELHGWVTSFAQALVEVVSGDRPVSQLLRCTSTRVYQDVARRVTILARTAPAPLRRRTVRPQVRSVHVCQPTPFCAEVSVHVRHGQRSRAIAARLEHRSGRWTCTAL
ncbi:MAG: Rv3235 family protein, partial [Nocardioidaceae bacterium]